jgi:hypothetical protein
VTKDITSLNSIFFNFIKWSQKLLNSSLFTDETEFIWNDWQEKIRDKLEINADHFDNDRAILVYIHSSIFEDAVKTTLAKCQHNSLNLYTMINDLLKKLAQLYNDSNKKTIIYKILSNLIINSHKKFIILMLIVDLKHYKAILSKFWMNKNEILLNMHHDMIVFSNQLDSSVSVLSISNSFKHSSELMSTLIFFTHALKILKRSTLIIQEKVFLINNINAAFFQTLIDWLKKNHTEVFAMFIENIDREIVYNI